jgi:hypothetical protein
VVLETVKSWKKYVHVCEEYSGEKSITRMTIMLKTALADIKHELNE